MINLKETPEAYHLNAYGMNRLQEAALRATWGPRSDYEQFQEDHVPISRLPEAQAFEANLATDLANMAKQAPCGLVKSEAQCAEILEKVLRRYPEGIRMCELKAVIRRDSGFWITEGVLGHNKLMKLVKSPTVSKICFVTSDSKACDHRVHGKFQWPLDDHAAELMIDNALASSLMPRNIADVLPEWEEPQKQSATLRNVIGQYQLPVEHFAGPEPDAFPNVISFQL
jgi:hypothetical protein